MVGARRSIFVLTLTLLALAAGRTVGAEPARPNIVVLLADDAGWGDYGHSGNRQATTPHIDSLAAAGVSLDRFFVCPVCAPTRAEFLTGRYHPRGGVYGVSLGRERLNLNEATLADALRQAGYVTGAFGKWHNGSQWPYHPRARGFDEYFGYTAGHWGEYFDAPLEDDGRMTRTRGYIVDVCADRAIGFIERNRERPFFCYVPFTTPHTPWCVPAENWERFRNLPITQRGADGDKEAVDETRCALAMLENQDGNVGRILAKLAELGLERDTIVVYFSDNGPNTPRWNGGMKGRKGSTDEGGVRSVCYWRWPARLPAGRVVGQIAGAIDLLPTLLSLAGVPRIGDKPLDGRDLSPLLLNESPEWEERMLFTTWSGQVSARSQQYRLDSDGQLFDMTADPGQTAAINDHEPMIATSMRQAVEAWRREMFGEQAPAATGGSVDRRPIPVGYREFPITMLPARDGTPRGGVRRSARAPNCSYFVNWTAAADSMAWQIAVATAGRYRVEIDYTCPLADAGAEVELSFLGSRLTGLVAPGWDPPLLTQRDTLPRAGESPMKEFRTLLLGEMRLEAGEGELTLRALEIPGSTVMDVRRVTLTLLD